MTDETKVTQDVTKSIINDRIIAMAELQQTIAQLEATATVQKLKHAKQQLKELDGEVRELALDSYQDNGAKHPHAAVSIKMRTSYEYDAKKIYDELAIDFYADDDSYLECLMVYEGCMSQVIADTLAANPHYLVINEKLLVKHFKAGNEWLEEIDDPYTETKEPSVNIAKDLSEFVK